MNGVSNTIFILLAVIVSLFLVFSIPLLLYILSKNHDNIMKLNNVVRFLICIFSILFVIAFFAYFIHPSLKLANASIFINEFKQIAKVLLFSLILSVSSITSVFIIFEIKPKAQIYKTYTMIFAALFTTFFMICTVAFLPIDTFNYFVGIVSWFIIVFNAATRFF